jgi:IS1 family transposase
MNRLSVQERAQIIAALVEGNSVRATCRLTGAAKGTVLKLLGDIGRACAEYQDSTLRGLRCRRVQCDEIWSFCYAKAKNVPDDKRGEFGYGDVWTWTAIDAESKLAVSWLVGPRDAQAAFTFIDDVRSRLVNRIQLTTDGHRPYIEAVEEAFGADIDYATLEKIYASPAKVEAIRYSPGTCIGTKLQVRQGHPDDAHISTSYVERQNLTMRMSMRRFTRLTNAFSKKVENHAHAVALHFMWYNFGRVHKTLGKTPAMAAGVADHPWTALEIAALLDKSN